MSVTSTYVARGSTADRHRRLLRAAKENVRRLKEAKRRGWDVSTELARARAQVKAFSSSRDTRESSERKHLIARLYDTTPKDYRLRGEHGVHKVMLGAESGHGFGLTTLERLSTSELRRLAKRYAADQRTSGQADKRRRHRSPGAPTFQKQAWISRKIRKLRHEGYPSKQAEAIAYRMAGIPARGASAAEGRRRAARRRTRVGASDTRKT